MSNIFVKIGNAISDAIPAPAAHLSYQAPSEPQGTAPIAFRGHTLTQADLKNLGGTLFNEISNSSPAEQQKEASMIANTAFNRMDQNKARGKNLNLTQILSQPGANGVPQYQGFGGKEYQRYMSGNLKPTDQQKVSAINSVLGQIKAGQLPNNAGTATSYTNQQIGTNQGSIALSPRPLFAANPSPAAPRAQKSSIFVPKQKATLADSSALLE